MSDGEKASEHHIQPMGLWFDPGLAVAIRKDAALDQDSWTSLDHQHILIGLLNPGSL